jgi:uncharacterized protein (TIGR01244 family)
VGFDRAKRVVLAFGFSWAASVSAAPDVPQFVEASLIPSYVRLTPSLAAAGQPTPDALRKLKEMGFKTVVNLRAEAEGPPDEAEIVRAAGLSYLSVPVTAKSFGPAAVEAVESALKDPAAGPVLLHCASSNRVGAVVAAMEARKGAAIDKALAAGALAGLRDPALAEMVRRLASEDAARGPARAPSAPAHPFRLIPPSVRQSADAKIGKAAGAEPLFEAVGAPFRVVYQKDVAGGTGEAEVHDKADDVFHVLAGEATFLVGGRLLEPREISPGEWRGKSIEAGENVVVGAGAMLVVPRGTPHRRTASRQGVSLVLVKVTGEAAAR